MHTSHPIADDIRARFLPPDPACDPAARGSASRGTRSRVLGLLGGAVIGAIGVGVGRWLAGPDVELPASLSALSMPWLCAGAVLMLWPNVVLHEAGHALAGIARGMQPLAFGIGPLRWERGQSRWRLRRAQRVGGISGFAALLPRGERGLSRVDQAMYLAGGPLANFATATLCAFAAFTLLEMRGLASFLAGTALCALFLGLVNLVPFHSQGWRSDGQGLVDLLRRSPDGELQLRVQRVLALCMAGVRPRDWPAELVPDDAAESASPMLAANGELLRLSWAMDRGDEAESARLAERLTARYHAMPPVFRPHLAVALAWHAARHLRDREVLDAWRALSGGGLLDLSLLRAWLDAESAALAGDAAKASSDVRIARSLMGRASDPVTALQLQEALDTLDDQIRRRDLPEPLVAAL